MTDSRTRRTLSAWGTEPRDGTPFHTLSTLRFNPFAKRFEALCHGEGGEHVWRAIGFDGHRPTWWLRAVPLPYELPSSFAFTLTYECRPKTRRERFFDWLLGKWPALARTVEIQRFVWTRLAIATEARRAETENTGSVHEGAGPQDIAQGPSQ